MEDSEDDYVLVDHEYEDMGREVASYYYEDEDDVSIAVPCEIQSNTDTDTALPTASSSSRSLPDASTSLFTVVPVAAPVTKLLKETPRHNPGRLGQGDEALVI